MIQILLKDNNNFTTAEMAQIAIECGCKWLIIPDMSIEMLREEAADIVAMCRETGTILTIINNTEVARELGLHGVMLTKGHNPAAVREELGPEAIIGAEISSVASATALATADIDYFVTSTSDLKVINEASAAGIETHFVADMTSSDIDVESMKHLKSKGFAGFMIGTQPFASQEPESVLKNLFESFV